VAREEILHVASSLPRDQEPASSCGIAFAWIDRPPRQEGGSPSYIVIKSPIEKLHYPLAEGFFFGSSAKKRSPQSPGG
jgi:FMN phosphatase YigB (HAD superfamily)